MERLFNLSKAFLIPLIIIGGIIFFEIFQIFHLTTLANVVILAVIFLGSFGCVKDAAITLSKKQFGLDSYIAILAIITAVITGEYLVGAILALMVSGGKKLEDYGVSMAKKSLTALVDRIPTDITIWKDNLPQNTEKISNIPIGTEIFIRKGEVIGLDGILSSEIAEIDESSLTGEPYFIEKVKGDVIRSGTVNFGQPIVIKVTSSEKDSTYKKIIDMVKQAQTEKSPMVRLADKYSMVFTLATLAIAGFAYLVSNFDLSRVLAVLAVATPCPLIIATPIALLGGINASARRKIIVKRLEALEVLSRVNTVLLDKTGTITLGIPKLTRMIIEDRQYTENHVISIAKAIERNSLHPLAKAIVSEGKQRNAKILSATHVRETIGKGISGVVEGKEYTLSKVNSRQGMSIELTADTKKIAVFHFEDEVKTESKETIKNLIDHGLHLKILTGDKKEAVAKVLQSLDSQIEIHAECTPEAKRQEVEDLKNKNKVIAMVGDGINDAPALALADVGLVFSNPEDKTAASEAADIVFLGGNFSMVLQSLTIARRTTAIAKQSILWGIGLSAIAMCFASIGLIPPIIGAAFQEAIDIAVILNALRASK